MLEDVVDRASHISSFDMSPWNIARKRIDFLSNYFSLEELEIDSLIPYDWGCRATAFGRKVPCLPSGLGKANMFVVTEDYKEFSGAATILFDGEALPRTRRVTLTPSMVIPKDFKELVMKAMESLDFEAEVWGYAKEGKAYIKKGDGTCLLTFYDALWYGFAHSATALAALSLYPNTKRTLIFVPRMSRWENFVAYCDTLIVLDGIGVSSEGLGSEERHLRVGGLTEYFGSPFDTPDKLNEMALRRHLRLLDSLLK